MNNILICFVVAVEPVESVDKVKILLLSNCFRRCIKCGKNREKTALPVDIPYGKE